jgi:polyphosphate kinase 2 (PPK2 family)
MQLVSPAGGHASSAGQLETEDSMKRIPGSLKVRGRAVRLAHWNPRATPGCKDKDEAAARLAQNLTRIDTLQYRLHGEARRSLLIVLQGMDTAGKDGVSARS